MTNPKAAASPFTQGRFGAAREPSMRILRPEEVTHYPEVRELSPEELREAYALSRAAFTADDLQRYAEVDEGIAAEEVLAELEAAQKRAEPRQG